MIILRWLKVIHHLIFCFISSHIYRGNLSWLGKEISSSKSLLWHPSLRSSTRWLLLTHWRSSCRWSWSRKSKWITCLALSCLISRAFLRFRFATYQNILSKEILKLTYRLFSRLIFRIPYYPNQTLSCVCTSF